MCGRGFGSSSLEGLSNKAHSVAVPPVSFAWRSLAVGYGAKGLSVAYPPFFLCSFSDLGREKEDLAGYNDQTKS